MVSITEDRQAGRAGLAVAVLFTATIFTSAMLLFFVQPLFTRMVLPLIGGAPAVWTTAMLFFQTVLIGGYLYAHILTRYLRTRSQVVVHLVLTLAAMAALPLAVPGDWSPDASQPVVVQTLILYAVGVGLPFAALSANAPLIQAWYRKSGGLGAEDPYFLYAASNLGSLVALLAFPLAAEPLFGISALSSGWSIGFIALGVLLVAAGLTVGRTSVGELSPQAATATQTSLGLGRVAYWAALAFLPSSLMLCVTTRISIDLGSLPLIWVVPLALYLLTFVLVFSARSPLTAGRLSLVLPLAVAYLVFATLYPSATPTHFVLLVVSFFIVALVAHRHLFDARPDAGQLTVYYLIMSVGGALGGVFNSIVAPLAFDKLTEFPLTVACVALLLARRNGERSLWGGIGLGGLMAIVVFAVFLAPRFLPSLPVTGGLLLQAGLATLIVLAAMYVWRNRGAVTATLVVAVTAVFALLIQAPVLVQDRSFFGKHVVRNEGDLRVYTNGNTSHGAQRLAELGTNPTPLFYYHPKGSLAEVVQMGGDVAERKIGIVGLGIGAMACYAKPKENWHFYEIDQKVIDIALDAELFDFMPRCGAGAEVHLGDARIVLQGQSDLRFDVLVIDAYSSNAVPVHLTTLEAVALYRDRLTPNGILTFHISNRYYDLAPPLAAIGKALGMVGRVKNRGGAEVDQADGDAASTVLVLANSEAALGAIATDPTWAPLPETDRTPWTDDHSNVLAALR